MDSAACMDFLLCGRIGGKKNTRFIPVLPDGRVPKNGHLYINWNGFRAFNIH
jgi:hypothetical protein